LNQISYTESDDHRFGTGCRLLARILEAQFKFGDETRGLYEHSLALSIENNGPDGLNAAISNHNIGGFYFKLAKIQPTLDAKRTQLLLAKSYYEEAQRIYSKIYGPTHPSTADASSELTIVLRELSQL
jgi:hypothetical protein